MVKGILGALESCKFVALSFTMNGSSIQVCGTARSNKGQVTPPVNLIVSPDELEVSLTKLLETLWVKGRTVAKKDATTEQQPVPDDEQEETEGTDGNQEPEQPEEAQQPEQPQAPVQPKEAQQAEVSEQPQTPEAPQVPDVPQAKSEAAAAAETDEWED